MKKWFVIVGLVILAGLIGIGYLVTGDDSNKPSSEVKSHEKGKRSKKRQRSPKLTFDAPGKQSKKAGRDKAVNRKKVPMRGDYEGRDLELSKELQSALDVENFDAACKAFEAAMKSDNVELRKEAVDAMSWFGEQALPELTAAMTDPDSDVAEIALNNADTALANMENTELQFATAASYMQLMTANNDALDAFGSSLSSSADKLCTPEDDANPSDIRKAADNRVAVIDTFKEMIGVGGKLSECAKEAYSYVSGNDWISVEEAHRWAANPDEYEPPDDADEN